MRKVYIRLIVLSVLPLVTVSTLNVLIYNALVKSSNLHLDESRYGDAFGNFPDMITDYDFFSQTSKILNAFDKT